MTPRNYKESRRYSQYDSYTDACKQLSVESLESRRRTLSLNFALKLLDSPQHEKFFQFTERNDFFLRRQTILRTPFAKTEHYKSSPLPALTRLLDKCFEQQKEEQGDPERCHTLLG